MSFLLACEMRLIKGSVHMLHSHYVVHPWCLYTGCHWERSLFPMSGTGHGHHIHSIPSYLTLACVFLLVRTEDINARDNYLIQKKSAMNSLKLFTNIHWNNLIRKTGLQQLTTLSFCFLFPTLFPCSRYKDSWRKQKWERKNPQTEPGSFWLWSPTKTRICTIQGRKSNQFDLEFSNFNVVVVRLHFKLKKYYGVFETLGRTF